MTAYTKAALLILIPLIYISNCTRFVTAERNGEYDIFSPVKKSEQVMPRFSPNRFNYQTRIQLCGTKLKDFLLMLCRSPLTIQPPSTRSSSTENQNDTPLVTECCMNPCFITTLMKRCPRSPQRPIVANVATIPHTPNNVKNFVPIVKPLEVYEQETGTNLICFPKSNGESTNHRLTDHLGKDWTRVTNGHVNNIRTQERLAPETENATTSVTSAMNDSERIKNPDLVVGDDVVEVTLKPESEEWGPPASEEIAIFSINRN